MAENRPFSRGAREDAVGIRDATRDIARFMKSMGADVSSFSRDFAAVSREADNFATYQANAVKSTRNVNKLLEKANNLRGFANKQLDEAKRLATDRNKLLIQVQKNEEKAAAARAKGNKSEETYYKNRAIALKEEANQAKTSSEAFRDQADNSKTLADQFESLSSKSQDLSRNVYGIAAGISETLNFSSHLTTSFEEANEIQRQKQIIAEDELELQGKINAALEDYNKDKAEGLKLSEKEFLANKNGALEGEKAAKRFKEFGLEGATEGATGSGAGANILRTQKGMENTRTALPSELSTMMKGLGKAVGALAKSLIVLKGIGKVVEFIQYAMFGVERETIDLARAFTLSREEAKVLRKNIGQIADDIKLSAANAADLVAFQIEFAKSTGFSTKLNQEQFKTITLMTKQLGFSNDEAIHMIENFKAAGVATEEGFNGLMKSYNAMKLQGKATTTFKALMHDITTDAELQRIYLTQGADAAMRNAQAQRRTGLSLAQQRSMAEGTLDFEKTMSDQLELQILTGKDINLQKAQELALQGKNGQAVAAIQKEMGKLTAEQRKSPIIMNKMLSVLGMSREEYYEMLNAQQLQAKAQKEEERVVKMLQKETGVFHELKKRTFKSELDFINELKGERKEEAEDALLNYTKSDEYAKDLNNLRKQGIAEEDLAQTALNNKIQEFSDQQIKNARIRAGLVDGELASFGNLRTTSEAFEDAMNRLKSQFANLVNQGVIEDLTTMLVDFVQRVSEVGLGSAILGGGAEEVAERQAEELLANAKSEEEREEIRRLLDQATTSTGEMLTKYASYGSLVGGSSYRAALAGNQEAAQLQLSKMAEEANTVDDFILRPGEPPIKFNKGDIVMGGTQLGMGSSKIESLLEQLLAETKAGKVIKMDTVTVANSLRRNAIKMNT